MQTTSQAQNPVRRLLAILFLAAALGLAYNQSSPLGLRWSKPPGQVSQATVLPNRPLRLYDNETVRIALDRGSKVIEGYQNQTLAMSFVPPLSPRTIPVVQPVIRSHINPVASPETPLNPVREMAWSEMKPLVQAGQMVLVDARGHSYYAADHIPGAISLSPIASAEEIAAFEAKYPRNTALAVYCSGEECSLAQRIAQRLITHSGYSNVVVLAGGYTGWRLAEAQAATKP